MPFSEENLYHPGFCPRFWQKNSDCPIPSRVLSWILTYCPGPCSPVARFWACSVVPLSGKVAPWSHLVGNPNLKNISAKLKKLYCSDNPSDPPKRWKGKIHSSIYQILGMYNFGYFMQLIEHENQNCNLTIIDQKGEALARTTHFKGQVVWDMILFDFLVQRLPKKWKFFWIKKKRIFNF